MSNPHDALFKFVFSRAENAASELRAVLPSEVATRVDWSSLELVPGTFVDERLHDRHTDVLFSVRARGRKALIYLVLEHQSKQDPLMAFRVLRYTVRVLDQYVRDNPKARRLPAVVPVVVYHGPRRWRPSTEFASIIDAEPALLSALAEHIPRFRFLLDDLSRADDAALRARCMTALASAAVVLFRDARGPALLASIDRWTDVFSAILKAPHGVAAFAALLEYIFRVSQVPAQDLHRAIQQLGPVAEEASMTIAEQLKRQGKAEGLAEGLAEGKAEGLAEGLAEGKAELFLHLLILRFGPLTAPTVDRVRIAKPSEVEAWAERVLTAASLEAVFS